MVSGFVNFVLLLAPIIILIAATSAISHGGYISIPGTFPQSGHVGGTGNTEEPIPFGEMRYGLTDLTHTRDHISRSLK
jgi:hypothetical protein